MLTFALDFARNTGPNFDGGSLVQLLVVVVVLSLVWYLISTYVPIPAPIKTVIVVIGVLILCLWLLRAFGLF